MLPPAHRMRRSADFSSAVRRGRRVRRGSIVVHQALDSVGATPPGPAVPALQPARMPTAGPTAGPTAPAVVGFVVGRSVGNSVVRHRVSRRLRAVVGARLADLPPGSATVVRALPEAAAAPSSRLAVDLDEALRRLRLTGADR